MRPRNLSTIAVLGTFDTKGAEHLFVAEQIRQRGHRTLLVDVGGHGESQIKADVTREQVAEAAGIDLAALRVRNDRGAMVEAMAQAAPVMLAKLAEENRIQGVISLGGTGGTAIGTAAMRALPLGFPKVMVSTVAAGNVAPYLGVKDIVMFPSIVDVAGLNRFSRAVFTRAAAAVCALAEANATMPKESDAKPLIVASMFGNTTQCVEHARGLLEAAGYEVLVFHATGTGGRTMESLIESGVVAGVLDITTTEWADELVGGVLNAGPTRLEAAARCGVPAIVTPGCLDMVNFGAPDNVPAKFAGRTFYPHNPQVTLMRTTPAECAELGRILAEKVNLSTGPVTVLLPKHAISIISAEEKPFHDAEADAALFDGIKTYLRKDIPLLELDCAINDTTFAEACVSALLANVERTRSRTV
ncbi:MAG: Tm-1-like ATP-binding domain-containing protein [Verrucomicrobiales bacterium]|nr:Tm-1-like ATP-binding domain-containing protein [Verrucomicrobiales bacterium]